jgi:glycosyltransferase involved in cell wall biosynthesis
MTAKLSIALPVYNGENFLRGAIEALLAQSYDDFELLISDNASTDSTESIAREFADRDPRVRYVRQRENIGAAPNFNTAFELCRAPFFKWAAHDDICLPNYLAECMEGIEGDESVVLSHSEVELIDHSGAVISSHDEELYYVHSQRPSVRFRDLILSEHWCTDVFGIVRRDALARTNLIGSYVGSDRTLLAELGLMGRFARVPRVLFQNRDHSHRSVHSTNVRSADRVTWFDTKAKPKITMPFVRCWVEYAKSVHRVSMPTSERLACYRALLSWVHPNRWRLRADVEGAARDSVALLVRRLPRSA